MNNIVFEEIPNNIKLIGSGAYGKCYCTKDTRVLKLFYDSVRNLYPNIERMSSIQSSYFEFPKDFEKKILIYHLFLYYIQLHLLHNNLLYLFSQ